jgi:undecaprenyl diphosphate synthase
MGIEALTLYAFSSENWRRPEEEVGDLMGLLRLFIRTDLDELVRENVRLRVIGDYRRFSPDLVALVEDAIARTCGQHRPDPGDRAQLWRLRPRSRAAARRLAEKVRGAAIDRRRRSTPKRSSGTRHQRLCRRSTC